MPVALKASQSVTVTVTFTPATAQTYSGTLTFTRSNGTTTSIGLAGAGTSGTSTTPPAGQTLLTTQVPARISQSDGAAVNYELGTVFRSSTAGQITVIRFWKDVNETGAHTGRIWSSTGQLLASVVFANETASGWQQQTLATPYAIAANTAYVVSVNTGNTYYVATTSGFASQVINGNLSSVVGNNGLYGATGTFPTISWNASNYFRDVVVAAGTTSVAPTITTQPSSQTITAGQTATFGVAATGTSPMTYQWKKNGTSISGATSSSYTTPAETTTDNNAQFSVAVINSAGSAASNAAVLTVNAAAVTPVAPTITTQPSSQTITAGQTATFGVAATGTSPMTYQWKKNGTAISGATSSSYTTPAETTTDNSAQFAVSVSNSAGSAASNAAILTVNAAVVAPAITTQPLSQTVIAGQTATFNVAATGTSPMTYQWKKNGTAISGATSSSYTTPAETTTDNSAQFAVSVSNSAGSATSNAAVLTVNAAVVAPAITTQPSSQAVIAEQTATFNVSATGTSPMTYLWMKNGTAISGATSSSYTTPAETTTDNNALFSVTVTNSAGNATSNSATLTVNAATLVLNSSASTLTFGNVNLSSSSSQNVTLTNGGNSNVTISGVSISGAGFNASGISSGLILTPGQTATLTATFSPASAGGLTGSVAVASNATNSPDTIALSGTGVTVVNHTAALSWTASSSTVIGYNTYSSTASGGPYTKLTPAPLAATSYTDTTVQAGLTYYYVVTSVESNNVESVYSTQVSATIP